MSTMRDIERLAGRMVMVGVRGAAHDDPMLRRDVAAMRDAHCRGVVLFEVDLPTLSALRVSDPGAPVEKAPRNIESPRQLRALTDHLHEQLGPGAMVSIDQEGGRVSRLNPRRGFAEFPSAAAYAEMSDARRADAAHAMAETIAAAGIDLNFAPCVDLASNPRNPIIAQKERAFAKDPRKVALLAGEVVRAHAEVGVRACLKHFPGHGSAGVDSHEGLPDITAAWDEQTECAPYAALLKEFRREAKGAETLARPRWPFAVMTGHLLHRRIDADHPASLSREWTEGWLRERLGFEGVVVTDSIDMGAITSRYGMEDAAAMAVEAGADIVLDGVNAPGMARPCPAPALMEAIARAAFDGRIEGGARRLRVSVDRIEGLFGKGG
jgi:beta-N-acetylhexosaminidase